MDPNTNANPHLDLEKLQTESRNPESDNIDIVGTLELCRIINAADHTIAPSITACLPQIALCIDLIVERVQKGGRVVYVGAGTSGRLGVLDASEIPPTFSSTGVFHGIIAGTDIALRNPVEGAEDLPFEPSSLSPPLSPNDTLIGIATSGRTPYVLSALTYAKSLGTLAVGLAFVTPSKMSALGLDVVIECVVGPEVVSGSTRMKAGSGTKMILNMISTGVMVRLGKTFGNLMIDVSPTNHKLHLRALRIFRTLLPNSQLSDEEVRELIKQCGGLKLALCVARLGVSVEEGRKVLDGCGGVLRGVWDRADGSVTAGGDGGGTATNAVENAASRGNEVVEGGREELQQVVLCVDAGGTKCCAVVKDRNGALGRAVGGPCNFVTLGHEAALVELKATVDQAVADYTRALASTSSRDINSGSSKSTASSATTPPHTRNEVTSPPKATPNPPPAPHLTPTPKVKFTATWIGGAGLDRVSDVNNAKARIAALFGIEGEEKVVVSSDAVLLGAVIALPSPSPDSSSLQRSTPPPSLSSASAQPNGAKQKHRTGAVLVLGTGSIAYSFSVPLPSSSSSSSSTPTSTSTTLIPTPLKRTGGWGYLLGDEGSAYDIGRSAIRATLRERDNARPLSEFMRCVVDALGCEEGEVISAVYDPARAGGGGGGGEKDPKLRVARICKATFRFAFPGLNSSKEVNADAEVEVDPMAFDIVKTSAEAAAENLLPLFTGKGGIVPAESTFVMGGALGLVKPYREMVLRALERKGYVFERVEVVEDVPGRAVDLLVRRFL